MQYCLDIFLFILDETQAVQNKSFDQNGKGECFSLQTVYIFHFLTNIK